MQCIYCQTVRAKNTTRQKQHLLQCGPYLQAHPDVVVSASSSSAAVAAAPATPAHSAGPSGPLPPPPPHPAPHQASLPAPHPAPNDAQPVPPVPSYTHDDIAADHTNLSFMPNPRINGSPNHERPSLGSDLTPASKKQKTKPSPGSNLPEIPLREVHAAFTEFRAKDDDKCLSARCLYCNQVRAKNTSRQREHLMACPGYLAVLKDKIPANNLRHQFDEDDVASSLALPAPAFDLDFRMSIRVKPKLNLGSGTTGRQSWISCIGGQWAGSWGKGVLLVSIPTASVLCPFLAACADIQLGSRAGRTHKQRSRIRRPASTHATSCRPATSTPP